MHLFFSCTFSRQVWNGICKCLDVQISCQWKEIQLCILQNRFVRAIKSFLYLRAVEAAAVTGTL